MSVPQINHKSLRDPQKKLGRLEAELKEARRVAEVNAAAKSAAEEADKKAREEAYLANRSQPSPTAPPVVERLTAGERTAADFEAPSRKPRRSSSRPSPRTARTSKPSCARTSPRTTSTMTSSSISSKPSRCANGSTRQK